MSVGQNKVFGVNGVDDVRKPSVNQCRVIYEYAKTSSTLIYNLINHTYLDLGINC